MNSKKIINNLLIASIFSTAIGCTSMKENTQNVFDSLNQINQSLATKNQETWVKAHEDYSKLSKTQFNALLIDKNPKELQKVADNLMDKINKFFAHASVDKPDLEKLIPTNIDGTIFISVGNKFLQLGENEAAKYKIYLNEKGRIVGASSTGDEANQLFKKATLEFLKAAKAFKANKNFPEAFKSYELAISAMNSIGHAPVNPYAHFIDWLIIFDAKIKANKMATKASIKNFNFYNLQEDAKNLIHIWEDKTAQESIRQDWLETNKLFFNKITLKDEIKTLRRYANPKAKSTKNQKSKK